MNTNINENITKKKWVLRPEVQSSWPGDTSIGVIVRITYYRFIALLALTFQPVLPSFEFVFHPLLHFRTVVGAKYAAKH